jgi:hypothetical protein
MVAASFDGEASNGNAKTKLRSSPRRKRVSSKLELFAERDRAGRLDRVAGGSPVGRGRVAVPTGLSRRAEVHAVLAKTAERELSDLALEMGPLLAPRAVLTLLHQGISSSIRRSLSMRRRRCSVDIGGGATASGSFLASRIRRMSAWS